MFNKQLLHKIYLANLSAIAASMSLSVWLLTFFIITLVIIRVADSRKIRMTDLANRKRAVLVFTGTFLVFILWMINTSDLNYGIRELEQKLPLLLIPLAIGLSDPPDSNELKTILSFFVAGVVFSSIAGLVYFGTGNIQETSDIRNISLFIPYMRLAEMTNMSIAISVYYFFSTASGRSKYLYLTAAVWLTCFVFILLSLTGVILFILLLGVAVFIVLLKPGYTLLKISLVSLALLFLVSAGIYISHEIRDFYKKRTFDSYLLKEKTINGNAYQHYPERKDIENGNPVWINICETEMRKQWNLRSSIKYDSLDLRKQTLKYTLIRYLTSKGFTKDSAGVAMLTDADMKNIENGITNVLFSEKKHLKSKLYEIIWQIDYYRNGGNPSGNSVTQRIEFLKTGWNCFKRNLIFGTGTGDLADEMISQYNTDKSKLDLNYRYLPHNQYLTFLISFGIAGFVLICFFVIYPVIRLKVRQNLLFNIFIMIILLSMLGEDTLETHTGVTFFAYFYSLFVFGKNDQNCQKL